MTEVIFQSAKTILDLMREDSQAIADIMEEHGITVEAEGDRLYDPVSAISHKIDGLSDMILTIEMLYKEAAKLAGIDISLDPKMLED